ncbi:NADH dehydrogenase [ubiquinone] 1 alpha subcomplex assembly factor 2-like [Liolophura sinensis]|uniref:NADH dehydrogenase [ubiquinone] 1 alpha subcomplex assembly factor 2-like n=1 Tax=Liolophura sinensis TaxID=3198878 RepID=UPI0031592A82
MSRRISVLGQVLKNLRNSFSAPKQTVTLVGEDHLGNRYFLKEADPKRNLRGGRWVEPVNNDQFKPPEVPVEWEAWLRGRRDDPPTQQELDKNHALMLRTLRRAQELEDKSKQAEEPLLGEGDSKPWDGVTSDADMRGSKFPVYDGMETTPGLKSGKR